MPSDSGDQQRRASPLTTKIHIPGVSPPEPEHLPCPRCDSTNTKFCYYNNYNFSQPRHFCKACRRYWTHGGTLRDIPVGGGTRKSAKRSRTTHTMAASTATSPLLGHTITPTTTSADNLPLPATPVLLPLSANQLGTALRFGCGSDGKVNGGSGGLCGGGGSATLCGSFTSLLNTQGPTGLLALGGFGVGVGTGLEDVSFGLGKGVWPFAGLGDGGIAGLGGNNVGVSSGGSGAAAAAGGGGGGGGMGSTWQLENGDNGFVVGGECFAWPDLAISTPGNGLK